ncbi:ATP-grasp domain-containing protein [Streptomyces sp. NPDC050703]|uniref:carboxylate--amine ligase n=1 Tax=Streptomyces sp. NPDC050703 TaxID=3157218 RepID=UPI00344823F9
MLPLDTRTPAVLLRIDRNPFHHGTLGAVRSLGRAGVEVHLVADDHESPVRHSRHLHRMHPPPAPGAPPAEVARALRRVARHLTGPAVLIPMDDAGALAVSALHAELSAFYLLPRPSGTTAEHVADKATLAQVCARAGVAHPHTLAPGSAAEAARAVRAIGLPAVAKWSRPWLLPRGAGLRSTTVIGSAREAVALFERRGEAGSALLLQAFVPGAGHAGDGDWFVQGCAGGDGAVRGGGTGRKHRSWPRSAGLTVTGEWTANHDLWSATVRLVSALDYRGIFDLDFRRDARTGDFHLIDFNPRPGAQFRLFADGTGTDVVRALHLDLTHRAVPAPRPLVGRTFLVENYAPLTALRALPLPGRREPSPPRELAWHCGDDPAPGAAMRRLWCRHVLRRLAARLRRGPAAAPAPAPLPLPAALPGPAAPADPTGPSGTTNRERAVTDA